MARRVGYRGGASGFGRRRSGGPSGAGRKGRPARRGQVKGGKAVQYRITDRRGKTTYVGTTNNPRRRAAEHKRSGKLAAGAKLRVETQPISRSKSERVEAAKIRAHRRRYGRNPRHNMTSDGRFH